MSEEITTDPLAPLTGEGVKPKRQLTEAQRLAFLKARETRARNVALRREQKMAEETANPPPEKKPRAKRAPKRDDGGEQRQRVKVTVDAPVAEEELPQEETQDVPEQIIDKVVESLVGTDHTAQQSGEPISSLPEMPDPHMYAKLVADIIYEKLNNEIVEPPSPPPKPKLKRAARNGRRARPPASPKEEEPQGHLEAKSSIDLPTPTPTQPSLAWM